MGVKINKQHQGAKQETRCPPPKWWCLERQIGIKLAVNHQRFLDARLAYFGNPSPCRPNTCRTELTLNLWKTSGKTEGPCTQDHLSSISTARSFFMFASCTRRATLSLSLKWDPTRCKHSMETAATASRRNSGSMWLKPFPLPHNNETKRPQTLGIFWDSTCRCRWTWEQNTCHVELFNEIIKYICRYWVFSRDYGWDGGLRVRWRFTGDLIFLMALKGSSPRRGPNS